ncbi:hypothetical protein RDABS01_034643 [Bienertia sinuspersici]
MGWKSKFLSLAGRATLAKSTLSTMGIYSMQSAKIPKSTCDDIDRKTRKFIMGEHDDQRKVHLISWGTLQNPKEQGGLGFQSMRQSNAAFLTKIGWRMLSEPTTLWARVLRNKYCQGRCDIDVFQATLNSSNLWKVGDGQTTLFWDHKWVENYPLIDVIIKEVPQNILGATVAEMWNDELGWKWDTFAEYLPLNILRKIQSLELSNTGCLDTFYWNDSPGGTFTVESAVRIIRGEENESNDKHWSIIWSTLAQNRNLTRVHPRENKDWMYTFPLTLWWVWKWRNQRVFREDENVNREEYIAWVAPEYGWVALNIDGAAKGCSGPTGASGILHNYAGQCLGFFANNLGECNAMRVELLALKRGLLFAYDLGIKQLNVRMDNQACTQIMNKEAEFFGPNLHLVKQCKELIARPSWTVMLSHCYREAIRAVDWLADRGVFQEIPSNSSIQDHPALAAILREDLIGVALPRMIRSGQVFVVAFFILRVVPSHLHKKIN